MVHAYYLWKCRAAFNVHSRASDMNDTQPPTQITNHSHSIRSQISQWYREREQKRKSPCIAKHFGDYSLVCMQVNNSSAWNTQTDNTKKKGNAICRCEKCSFDEWMRGWVRSSCVLCTYPFQTYEAHFYNPWICLRFLIAARKEW